MDWTRREFIGQLGLAAAATALPLGRAAAQAKPGTAPRDRVILCNEDSNTMSVIDPGTKLDIMRMKLVTDLSVDQDGTVNLTFCPSSPVCPMAFKLAYDIQRAVRRTHGVNGVKVKVRGYDRADELMKVLEQAKNQ